MAGTDIRNCCLCKRTLADPRILACSHSFCLKCLESSSLLVDSPKCPLCGVIFKIPEGGFKGLKKNDFVEHLNKLLLHSCTCDSCDKNQAVNFCIDCSFHYCATCLKCHGKNPASKNHRLQQTESESGELMNFEKYHVCEIHSEMKNLYCEDCNAIICCACFASDHNEHKKFELSEKLNEMRDYLELKINMREENLELTTGKYRTTKKMLNYCQTKAAELKKKIQQRGEVMKELIDSIVAEMSGKVDKELAQHEEEAGVVLKKLKEMETDLNARIESLKQKLSNLNFENVVEISSEGLDDVIEIPSYSKNFQMSLSPHNNVKKSNLEEIFGFLKTGKLEELKRIGRVQPQLQKQYSLDRNAMFYAVGHDDIYVVIIKKILIYSVSNFAQRSYIDLENLVSCIFGLETVDDVLYVNVSDIKGIFKILKITFFENYKTEIVCILTGNRDKWMKHKLSKLKSGCLMIPSGCDVEVISQSGSLVKTIKFSDTIYNAVEYDDEHFVVCSKSFVGIIDRNGSIRTTFLNSADVSENVGVAVDKFKNVFICKTTGQAFIFHHYNKFESCHAVAPHIYRTYYDKYRNVLWCLSVELGQRKLLMYSLCAI